MTAGAYEARRQL